MDLVAATVISLGTKRRSCSLKTTHIQDVYSNVREKNHTGPLSSLGSMNVNSDIPDIPCTLDYSIQINF
jgi:hypothetical protein